jgi:hypothetical protein
MLKHAFELERRALTESLVWPLTWPGADTLALLVRRLASWPESIFRPFRSVRIRVPPMSESWLQMYENDSARHGENL